ncbi:MAG: PH domain-containing protein [Nanoarchaeota archaeon]
MDRNEKVLWEGKPKFFPYVLRGIVLSLFGLFFMIVAGFIQYKLITQGNWYALFIPHFWVGLAMLLWFPIYNSLNYKYVYYVITNKRVIFQQGIIGRDFGAFDFDQVTDLEVNIGVWDKLVGRDSGTIIITAQRYCSMYNIPHPYEVFKFFKGVSYNIKTDINYPNKYRPQVNPGYNTEYKPRK